MKSKLRKLYEDPVAYCLDSQHGLLRWFGQRAFQKQTDQYGALGAANSHRKITVIMTAYNTGGLVTEAVQSVLAQSHSNFELMVIDDASSDDTLAVLQEIAETDARIRVFHSPTNHGTYWSKNWCLSKADGEFVAFHDSDDVSDPLRLQLQLGAMLDGKGSDAVTCRWQRINPEGELLTIDGAISRTSVISLMIRREAVLNRVGYFDTVRIAADTEYKRRITKLLSHKRLRNMRHVLYTGLLRDQSLTRGEQGGFEWRTDGLAITRSLSGNRADYMQAFQNWHTSGQALYVSFPQKVRPFAVSSGICHGCDDMNTSQVVEVTAGHG